MKQYLFLFCLMASIVGCTDDIEEDVDNLMKVQPKGITLLEDKIIVQNSDRCEINFRVNPSHYPLEAKDISLDVLYADISRTFPISSIPEYQLEEVVQVSDEAGNPKEGEWKAIVQVNDGRYYSDANLALVLNYKDAQGKDCMLTSSSFAKLMTVPIMKADMVNINNYMNMSAYTSKGKFSSHEFTCTPAPLSEGSKVLFNMEEGTQIDSFKVDGPNAGLFLLTQIDKWKFKIEPDFFFKIPDSVRYVDADLVFYFRDRYCDDPSKWTIQKRKNIKFYKTKITPDTLIIHPSDIVPRDTVNHVQTHFNVPVGNILAQCGITDEALKEHPLQVFTRAKLEDGNGGRCPVPVMFGKNPESDSRIPSKECLIMKIYSNLQDKHYGVIFNVIQNIQYINPVTGEEWFYCEMKYPMKFVKE